MNIDKEQKIYEKLGIKKFKKLAFLSRFIIIYPFTLHMTKKERKNFFNSPSNYNIKKGNGLQDLQDFKYALLFNIGVHIASFNLCLTEISKFFGIIKGVTSKTALIISVILGISNIYCIMLQRYNWIRINKVIKKFEPMENEKKENLKKELTKEDSLIKEHTYKIMDKKNIEKEITFDKLIENASIKELKMYKKYFVAINNYLNQKNSTKNGYIYLPIDKKKKLKLEIMQKNN